MWSRVDDFVGNFKGEVDGVFWGMDIGCFEDDLEVVEKHFTNFEGRVKGLEDMGGDL